MQTIKNLVFLAIVLLLLILALIFYNKANYYKSLSAAIPDTVYVPKPYKVVEIQKKYIEKPVRVLVYPRDSALRKALEHQDIITGIDITPNLLTIDKIKPGGVVFSHQYILPSFREIKIDPGGNVRIKKKRYLGLKILGAAVIAGTTAYLITK